VFEMREGKRLVGTFWRSGCGDVFSRWGTSQVSCGRQEWRIGAFSVEGNLLGLLGVESK